MFFLFFLCNKMRQIKAASPFNMSFLLPFKVVSVSFWSVTDPSLRGYAVRAAGEFLAGLMITACIQVPQSSGDMLEVEGEAC